MSQLYCFYSINMNVSRLVLRFTTSAIKRYKIHVSYPCAVNIKFRTLCSTIDVPLPTPNDNEFNYESEDPLANLDINAIVGEDTSKIEDVKRLFLEVSLLRQEGCNLIPENMTAKQWRTLLRMPTPKRRLKCLEAMYANEKRKLFGKHMQTIRSERRTEERAKKIQNTDKTMIRDLSYNSLFFRIKTKEMHTYYDYKLALAMMFGQHLVIDCSYEDHMRESELKGCALQIQYAWSYNRKSVNPFNIILCNVKEGSKIIEHMKATLCNLESPNTLITITNKDYMELYPREQLVYLTPHCGNELEKYDGNSVYIIGAYVDEIINKPLSLVNARKNNLRTAKFPIDTYLNWCQGSKYLPINQCLNIMNDLKNGACWQYAFRHIGPRKQSFHRFDNDIKNKGRAKSIVTSYFLNQQQKSLKLKLKHLKKFGELK